MAKVKQLNAVLKGKTVALDNLCSALGKAKVNIHGIMATGEVLRLLVDDLDKAIKVLDGLGVHNAVEEVLGVTIDHKPGAVADVVNKLARNGVRIRYAYAAATPDCEKAIFILSVTDMTDALEALR
jgi:hypothetical protein